MAKSRQTRQKEIIEEELKKQKPFFTSEELYVKVKRKDIKIGIATIYRFLKNLRKNNKICHYTCNNKSLYSNKKSHSHFICEKCGEISHFELKDLSFLKNKLSGEICHFQIDVRGICDKCLKNEKPN